MTPADRTPVPPHLSDAERALWEKADAATPGPWEAWNGGDTQWIVEAVGQYVASTLSSNDEANAAFLAACSPDVIHSLLTALSSERAAGDKARIDALAALLDVEGGVRFGVFFDGSWKIETDNDDYRGTGLRDVLDRLPAPSTETPHD